MYEEKTIIWQFETNEEMTRIKILWTMNEGEFEKVYPGYDLLGFGHGIKEGIKEGDKPCLLLKIFMRKK